MQILFLSRWFPFPIDNGSKLRVFNLLQGLAKHHAITLLSFNDRNRSNSYPSEIQSLCQEIKVVPWKTFESASFRARLGLLSTTPRSIKDTFSAEMARQIQDTLQHGNYQLVIASELGTASYRKFLNNIPAIFEDVELGYFYEQVIDSAGYWKHFRHNFTWIKHRFYMRHLIKSYQACTVVSKREFVLINKIVPEYTSVSIVPNSINLSDYQNINSAPQPNTLIFTGSFNYDANYQAMNWFVSEVFPKIQSVIPDVQLTITGDNKDRPLPYNSSVILTGFVNDIRTLIANSWISLAPIMKGGGTRNQNLRIHGSPYPCCCYPKRSGGYRDS